MTDSYCGFYKVNKAFHFQHMLCCGKTVTSYWWLLTATQPQCLLQPEEGPAQMIVHLYLESKNFKITVIEM